MTNMELLKAMGELDDELIEPKEKTASKVKWRRWVALAACVALVLTLGQAWYYGNTIELGSGDRLSLGYGGSLCSTLYDVKGFYGCEVQSRIMTHGEVSALMEGYPMSESGYGDFNRETGKLLGFSASGSESSVSFYVSSVGRMWPTSTSDVNGKTTVANGVPITAGYTVWNGKRITQWNISYFAELELEDQMIRIALSGSLGDKQELEQQLADAIDYLLQKGRIDLSQVKL